MTSDATPRTRQPLEAPVDSPRRVPLPRSGSRLAGVAALFFFATALVSLPGLGLGLAVAGDSEAERTARLHFHKGEARYAAGRFADALTEYQAGYDAVPLPGFLVNIAQCQRRLGDLRHAHASYQKFVLVAPDSPLVPEVRKLITDVERLMAEADGDPAAGAGGESPGDEVLAPGGSSVLSTATVGPAAEAPGKIPRGKISRGKIQPGMIHSTTGTGDAPSLLAQPVAESPPASTHHRFWLWGSIGAAVVGGTVAAIVLSRPGAPETIHDGTLGTLRR
jgi:hypothetical protein